MSLRDVFAIAAMAALVDNAADVGLYPALRGGQTNRDYRRELAERSYEFADTMLEARKK